MNEIMGRTFWANTSYYSSRNNRRNFHSICAKLSMVLGFGGEKKIPMLRLIRTCGERLWTKTPCFLVTLDQILFSFILSKM